MVYRPNIEKNEVVARKTDKTDKVKNTLVTPTPTGQIMSLQKYSHYIHAFCCAEELAFNVMEYFSLF